ncbi:Stress-associated endoplasmic reticulum protein 2, partial [Bienertia sinuspersici]
QTTSRRLAGRKVEKFEKNIKKRGLVSESTAKKGNSYPVGPVVLGFFVFVVIGSCKQFFLFMFSPIAFLWMMHLIYE